MRKVNCSYKLSVYQTELLNLLVRPSISKTTKTTLFLRYIKCVQRKLNITGTAIEMHLKAFVILVNQACTLFKSQWLTLIRAELLNINFTLGLIIVRKMGKARSLIRDNFG